MLSFAPLSRFVASLPVRRRRPAVRALATGATMLGTLAMSSPVWAQDLLSRPEIEGYPMPTNQLPAPRTSLMESLDVVALVVALSLASYFSVKRRSRKGLFLLSIASLLWFGFWRKGCVCSIGAIQNVTLAAFDPTYTLSVAVVAFFALPLVFTLFFGRGFCAAVCPLGAIQELFCVRPVKTPVWLDHVLGMFVYIYLGAAVLFAATGTAFIICEYDPFVAFFRLTGSVNMLTLGACFLVVGLFIGRPYCRYLCPYGGILALLAKVSKWHLRIPPEDCINCRLCEDSCPYGAIHPPTVEQSRPERRRAKRRLVGMMALAPVLVILGLGIGWGLAIPLAARNPEVQLAEQVRLEELDETVEVTDASEAFRETGRSTDDLYTTAMAIQDEFQWAGMLLGGWVGLVIALKLLHLSIRRRRADYHPDQSGCVSCGRCFWYCPCEQERLGLIETIDVVVPPEGTSTGGKPTERIAT